MLYKSLKMLHLIGIVLFLGSVFGHVATGVLGGAPGGSPEFIAARENISALTRILTLPGLGLAIVCGLGMASVARINPLRTRWLAWHGGLALAIVILTAIIVAPAGLRIRDAVASAASGAASLSGLQADLLSEHTFGGANIVLALLAMAVAIWRPLGDQQH